ncbi:MAG: histidinol-phosphate transaminase [Bacteroidaceae bacterium]|nr:histidinol-phosphate transaminase [Bacteroidaceae bacterium]
MKPLQDLVRPNIWALQPYSCARDEFQGEASVYLDANENPFNAPINRYPDPRQTNLKERLSVVKGIPVENICLGNGSDECIDLIYRIFCEPAQDNVVAIAPTYGMYRVCADINNVAYREVLLDSDFQLNATRLLGVCDAHTKVIWLCSPNNPTGNCLNHSTIQRVLREFDGIVVVDEAYGDFADQPLFRHELKQWPNLVVLNTFSKCWASAGIRLGMAFASKEIIELMHRVKYPYNINTLTQRQALDVLSEIQKIDLWRATLLRERMQMLPAIAELPICEKVYPTDANFFLAKMTDAKAIYQYLMKQGIIVRDRSRVQLCDNCLRITIGTPQENNTLLGALRRFR